MRTRLHLRALGAVALLMTLLPGLARAQAYERIAPQEPPTATPPMVTPPAEAAPVPASNEIMVPALKGLVFLPGIGALHAEGLPVGEAEASRIDTTRLPLLSDAGFTEQVKPFLGRPLSFAGLQEITRLTSNWYRAHGRPFVRVNVPQQNASSGVVQIVVTDYRVGEVRVAGNRWFSSDLLRGESGLKPGESLSLMQLQDDLDWLNSNPFRTVDTLFEPGSESGTTDVVLQTQDRLPLRFYTSFDNAGVPSLGRGEWSVGASWGNLFGLDQLLGYQFTRSMSGRYEAHALSWTVPLPWRDKLLVFGSYATQDPDVGTQLGMTGKSGQASLRYVHTLPRLAILNGIDLTQNVQIGYDFKTTNSNLEFGGTQVYANHAEVDQFPLIYTANATDAYGQTAFENQLVFSPGGLSGANNNLAFETIVPGSGAAYTYDRIGLTRSTFLPKGFSWSTRVIAQVSNRNLMYSEQLNAAGADSVRGYDTDAALGSRGVLVSEEIRGPSFSLGSVLGGLWALGDQEQLGLFWDYGSVSQVRAISDSVNTGTLSSVGVSLNAGLGRYVSLKLDAGWRLRDAPGTSERGTFGDFAMVLGF